MNKVFIIFAALLACAWAYNRYEPSYVQFESDEDDDDDVDSYSGKPYGFEYDVKDGNNNFGHRQESDGQVTTGSYRVELPDGRTQIVTYRADENGYNAQVTYEPTKYPTAYYSPQRAPAASPWANYHQQPASVSPKPLLYRTWPTTTTTTPAPLKPLLFRNSPFYEFPGIAPYHGPSNAYGAYDHPAPISYHYRSSYEPATEEYASSTTTPSSEKKEESEDSDEESSPAEITPLLFRNNVEKVNSYDDQHHNRIPYVYRSSYSKRSPIEMWSEAAISEALETPAVEEEIAANHQETATTSSQLLPSVEEEKPQVFEGVESQTDSPHTEESFTSAYEEIDFDDLPFPLPLPLAFRPEAV